MYHRSNEDPTDQLGRLLDSLTEHQPDDPNFGPPENFPWWTDLQSWTLGAETDPDDPDFFVAPDDDEDSLERLERELSEPLEPDDDDSEELDRRLRELKYDDLESGVVTAPDDLADLRWFERFPEFNPSEADMDAWERLTLERRCNSHWA